MLKLRKDPAKARASHDEETHPRQIFATDHQIDTPVYEPYDLTADEIRVAEDVVSP